MDDSARAYKFPMLDNKIVQQDMAFIYDHFPERSKLKNATVLITGCAGFLGFYLTYFLLQNAGHLGIKSVIGLDRLARGTPEWITELKVRYPQLFDIHPFDIAADDLSSINNIVNTDYILHMASIASPTFYRQFPLETIDANIWGLRSLLDYFQDKKLKGLLFFSSSEIYGDPEDSAIPTQEDYPGRVMTMGPRACYDESKRFGEMLCYTYAQKYKMPISIVRPFNNYGPGLDIRDKRVPADFAAAVLKGDPIVIHSDGRPTRTFCYVADAVVGYLKTLTYGQFDFFNIGIDHPEVSVKDLAEIYVKKANILTGYAGAVEYEQSLQQDYLTHNPNRRCPNIDKARTLLKFQPSVLVDQGVERYLKFLLYQEGRI